MPKPRDASLDGHATQLLRKASKAPGQWLVFRISGDYERRLVLQRALYYIGGNPGNPNSMGYSVQVQWRDASGEYMKLSTPLGTDGGTTGSAVGRIRVHSKAAGRKVVEKQIEAGASAYDLITPR